MLFNSFAFVVFFTAFVFGYFALPLRYRKLALLAASYYFYMSWRLEYGALLLASTAIDYWAGLRIDALRGQPSRQRAWLLASLLANVGSLVVFKYLYFLGQSVSDVAQWAQWSVHNPVPSLVLPVGISFYTFQSMSYTIDVYRQRIGSEPRFVDFALYVSFFPQLVAGPIERFEHLRPQFDNGLPAQPQRIANGLKLMFWGYFQKLVIADNMASFVDAAYAHPQQFGGASLLVATVFFAFQIYCDFAGYTDIARGAARILGIELMINFHRPYFSFSFIDFWRRWHISLFDWFKQYVYIELGGNRRGPRRRLLNIGVVFVLSGLWHGASWTFVVWGLLNGLIYIAELALHQRFGISELQKRKFYSLERALRTLLVFALVNLTWVFFRAQNLGDALVVLHRIVFDFGHTVAFGKPGMLVNALLIGLLMVAHWHDRHGQLIERVNRLWWPSRWALYLFLGVLMLGLGNFGAQQFIYFQF